MTAHWDADVIATVLKKYVSDHSIDTVCYIPFMILDRAHKLSHLDPDLRRARHFLSPQPHIHSLRCTGTDEKPRRNIVETPPPSVHSRHRITSLQISELYLRLSGQSRNVRLQGHAKTGTPHHRYSFDLVSRDFDTGDTSEPGCLRHARVCFRFPGVPKGPRIDAGP